jgi:hypothetical protein
MDVCYYIRYRQNHLYNKNEFSFNFLVSVRVKSILKGAE